LDRAVWREFHSNWSELVLQASQLRERRIQEVGQSAETLRSGPTETLASRKVRVGQDFFREAVLSAYDERCCVTGLRIRECLIASHIVPWSLAEEGRADPHNGLCLSATFDRLFDRGFMTVDTDLRVVLAASLREGLDRRGRQLVGVYHGRPIAPPRRFAPSPVRLEWHRQKVFRGQ